MLPSRRGPRLAALEAGVSVEGAVQAEIEHAVADASVRVLILASINPATTL